MGNRTSLCTVVAVAATLVSCSDGSDGKAVERGVGEACAATAECRNEKSPSGADARDAAPLLECLTEFKGGYCGLTGCAVHTDCPEGSMCVVADSGTNYCFLKCVEKPDCNVHRSVENEANCSSNVTMVDGTKAGKVCVPPTGN